MAFPTTPVKYVIAAALGCIVGASLVAWRSSKKAKEELVGRTSIATLNDLAYISMIGNNNQTKAKHYMERMVIQDIRDLGEFSKIKGESGRLAQETIRRVVCWRDQHPALDLSPELQAELKALQQQ